MVVGESGLQMDHLRVLNAERLAKVEKNPIVCFAFDAHGFVLPGNESPNDPVTSQILDEEVRLLSEGCVLAAVTGFSDRINLFLTRPLGKRLQENGIDPLHMPFYLSTRNGAVTAHGFNPEDVIDSHPMSQDMYHAITSHRLVRAIHALTSPERMNEIARGYVQIVQDLGYPLHPNSGVFPGIRHDWHPTTKAGYQLTVMYEPERITQIGIHDDAFSHVRVIAEYCSGNNLPSVNEMASIIKTQLYAEGVFVNTNTAASHPEIDIALPQVNKSLGCTALLPRIQAHWQDLSESEVRQHSIGGGDSPGQNDRPLVKFFGAGVTNVDYWKEGIDGPIVLDYDLPPLERTLEFLKKLQVKR